MDTSLLKRIESALPTLAAVGSVAVYMTALVLSGGSPLSGVVFWAILICLVIFPGLFLQRLLLNYASGAMRISFAFCMGSVFLFLNFAIFSAFLPVMFTYVIPVALCLWEIALVIKEISRGKVKNATKCDFSGRCILIMWSVALFVFCFAGVLAFAKASKVGNMVYGQDMLWGAGNAASVQGGFPLKDIRAQGGILHYHYLGDVVVGLTAMAGNILPYEAEIYYFYPVVCLVMILSLYAVAKEYTGDKNKALLFPFALLFLNGMGGNSMEIMRNMNNVATATLFTSALLCLIFSLDKRENLRTQKSFLALALLGVGSILTKNMYGAMVLCAILAALAARILFSKKIDKWGIISAVTLALVLLLAYIFVFDGANNNLVLQPKTNILTQLVGIFKQQPIGIILFVVAGIISIRHIKSLRFSLYLVNAAAIGSVLAYLLFSHYSGSEIYFVYLAIYFFIICAMDGIDVTLKIKPVAVCMAVLASALMVGEVIALAPVGRQGIQIAMRSLGMRPQYPLTTQSIQSGDEEGAMYLRENMAKGEVFAVNRTSRDMQGGDGVWHYYTAMSGRQAYVEGWRYIMDYGYDYYQLRHRLEQVEDVIYQQDDTDTAYSIARENGIDYLLVSLSLKPKGFAGDSPVFKNDAVEIYKVK